MSDDLLLDEHGLYPIVSYIAYATAFSLPAKTQGLEPLIRDNLPPYLSSFFNFVARKPKRRAISMQAELSRGQLHSADRYVYHTL